MAINLARNTRLWVSTVTTGHNNSNTFEVPIQDGYTLSQSASSTDISPDEAGATPTRGSKRFNESLDPVEWALTSYITPYVVDGQFVATGDTDSAIAGKVYTVDMLLWHAIASGSTVAPEFHNDSGKKVAGSASEFSVEFGDNDAHQLFPIFLYFRIDNQTYLVEGVQINQAEISVDISDIGQISWSGQGTKYTPIADPAFMAGNGNRYADGGTATPVVNDSYVAIPANKEYIINKLTEMTLVNNDDTTNGNYDIPITSASVTIANNVTYLTPNTLAQVDSPIGSFTGTFEVTGSVEAYLRDTGGAGTVGAKKGSAELLSDMLATAGVSVTTDYSLVINMGGTTGTKAILTIPHAHLAIPEVSVEDLVSASFEFKGIPQDAELNSGDEISVDFETTATPVTTP